MKKYWYYWLWVIVMLINAGIAFQRSDTILCLGLLILAAGLARMLLALMQGQRK